MYLSKAEKTPNYRTLAEYEQVVLPQLLRLDDMPLAFLRGLILKYHQQRQAVYLHRKFNNQAEPKYYQTCGQLIPPFTIKQYKDYRFSVLEWSNVRHSFTIKQHTSHSIRCTTLPASHWAPVTQQAISEKETYWRYNNHFLRPLALSDYRGGQLKQVWGWEEMEAKWRQQGNLQAYLAEQLNKVARYLREDKSLEILLEPEVPRLKQLRGEKKILGYVAYFFDCLDRFHEYEQAAPSTTVLADAGAATAGSTGADRWAELLIDYTLADLSNLLVFAGLLETAEPLAVAEGTKPGQWVAVAAALYKCNRTRADKAALYRAFSDTYGAAVGSERTFQNPYNEANELCRSCYERALSRLS